jgi:hypothetical protein
MSNQVLRVSVTLGSSFAKIDKDAFYAKKKELAYASDTEANATFWANPVYDSNILKYGKDEGTNLLNSYSIDRINLHIDLAALTRDIIQF